MLLADWIRANGLNMSSFGRSICERPMTIARYCLPAGHVHRRIPKEGTMRKIVAATGGAVTPNDFYGLPPITPEGGAQGGAGDPAGAPLGNMEAAE